MKILLIRFSSAGDVILTSLLVRCLRRRFPDADVHFLTKRSFAPLLEHSPYIDRVFAIESHERPRQLARRKAALIAEDAHGYDLVLDLHNSIRSRYFRLGLGRRTLVFEKPTVRKWLLVHFRKNLLRPVVPVAERYLTLAHDLDVENDGAGLDLFTGGAYAAIEPLPERPTIALAPGARHATKRWPVHRFVELGCALITRWNARVVLLGGGDEHTLCEEIRAGILQNVTPATVLNLAGGGSILDAAATIDACDAVVSNDSALAHVAAARKRPVVAIFGSTVQEFGFAPYGTTSRVVENLGLSCRPCTTIGRLECPKGHFQCMLGITAAEVASAVEAVCHKVG